MKSRTPITIVLLVAVIAAFALGRLVGRYEMRDRAPAEVRVSDLSLSPSQNLKQQLDRMKESGEATARELALLELFEALCSHRVQRALMDRGVAGVQDYVQQVQEKFLVSYRSGEPSQLGSWERVADSLSVQIWQEKNAAEPGATDNPDDAQRLREDH